VQNGENYHCLDGYSQSMLAIILFDKSLSKMYGDRSITAFSANPGSESEYIQRVMTIIDHNLIPDTKTNVQTYVSMDEIETWLERKRIGLSF